MAEKKDNLQAPELVRQSAFTKYASEGKRKRAQEATEEEKQRIMRQHKVAMENMMKANAVSGQWDYWSFVDENGGQ